MTTKEDGVLPEPKPDWDGGAQDTLGWLWPAHVYLFAVIFVILGLTTILLQVFTRSPRRSKNIVKAIMLCAIVALSVSRAVILFVDPYLSSGSTSMWWNFGCVLVTGLGTSSLTASLAILLYITTVSTRVTSVYRHVYLGRVVCGISLTNFVFFTVSDVITTLSEQAKVGETMLTICQITFALWGLVISSGFVGLTYKLRRNARATFEQARFNANMKNEGHKLQKLSVLLATLSVTSAIFFVLRIYEGVSGLSNENYSDTWAWWSVKTILRSLEIINAIVLLLVFKKEAKGSKAITGRRQNTRSESEQHNTSVKLIAVSLV